MSRHTACHHCGEAKSQTPVMPQLTDVSDSAEIVVSFLNSLALNLFFRGDKVTSAVVAVPTIPRYIGEKITFVDFHVTFNRHSQYASTKTHWL